MDLIRKQKGRYNVFYILFGVCNLFLLIYYLSNTIIAFTTPQQFPIQSFLRFPLSILIFPVEVYSILFGLYFVYLLLNNSRAYPKKPKGNLYADVAILIPIYHEPAHIVERTVKACKKISWPKKVTIYLLDDSTNQVYKKQASRIAKTFNCKLVRRDNREGYKAGNINNALSNVITEDYFVILDSDQAPKSQFLEEAMPYLIDKQVGFVQTPQYYLNDSTPLERAAKMGTNIFFQTQCAGKSYDGATPFCGTNAIIRTEAFKKVRGFSYYTSTEDIELGIKINNAGYRGTYLPMILIEGFGPIDFPSYRSQQYRWANGNLAILRERAFHLITGNFSLRYLIHTFFTLSWWFIGIVSLIFIMVPLTSLFFSLGTHHAWLPSSLIMLLYFNVGLGISLVYVSLHGRYDKVTLRDALLQYSLITNSMFIYTKAALNVVLKRYIGFERTNKSGSLSNYWDVKWNLILAVICYGACLYALFMATRATDIIQLRSYLPISLWLLFYTIVLTSSIIFIGTTGATEKTIRT